MINPTIPPNPDRKRNPPLWATHTFDQKPEGSAFYKIIEAEIKRIAAIAIDKRGL